MNIESFLRFLGKEFDFDTTGITAQTAFEEFGFDEFDMIELVMSVEDNYHVEVPDEVLRTFRTVGDFVRFLDIKLS